MLTVMATAASWDVSVPEQHGQRHNQHDEESGLRRQANLGEARVEEGAGHASAAST